MSDTLLGEETTTEETTTEETAVETTAEETSTETPVVPEEYAEFTMPEGIEADKELLEKALPLFKEMKLTQEQAQQLVDLQAQSVQKYAEGQVAGFTEQLKQWEVDAKSDKEIGGDAFSENLGIAKLGLEKVGTPELRQFLAESGAGSHPEVIRAFLKIGRMVKEDNPGATGASKSEKSLVDRLYPQS